MVFCRAAYDLHVMDMKPGALRMYEHFISLVSLASGKFSLFASRLCSPKKRQPSDPACLMV